MNKNKKGVSPVIATTLLILLAVIIAVIIFIWVRSFIGEKVKKDVAGDGVGQPIENYCGDLSFSADVSSSSGSTYVVIQNNGNIPIYGVSIIKKGLTSSKNVALAYSLNSGVRGGDSEELSIKYNDDEDPLEVGDKVTLIPVLMGVSTVNEEERKTYPCDSKFGIETSVAQG